jgi:DNA-binding NtrC family response regulator
METLLSKVIEKLARAEAFEDAAEVTLGTAIEITRLGIQSSPFSKNARVLRAILHHRPDDGYRRLIAVEVSPEGALSAARIGDGSHVPSAIAWQWVRGHESAAAVDLVQGTVVLANGVQVAPAVGAKPGDNVAKVKERDATHMFVVPIRAPGHRIDGMLVVEASCRAATGTPFVWESCREALSLLAAIAAPYLARLPIARVERTTPDEQLPVIGQSMQCVVEMLRVFAKGDETVLLYGPSGAGKAGLARWMHERSPFKGGPFEVVHLSNVPDDQQMAELFGSRKMAPGLPAKDVPGAIARTEKGTLFIDDFDRLAPSVQAALLRLLEEKRYRMFGDESAEKVANVRLVLGTNADLKKLADEGKLRSDLYYRINVLAARIAPLRERQDEIIEWAEHMLHRRHAAAGATSEATLTQDAAAKLVTHDWPGNLRQLDNIIRRAYALAQLDHSAHADGIAIRAEHIDRALQYEGKGSPRTLLDHLDSAAEAFVAEAERRTETGIRLDMDLADSFKGLVIEAAKRRWSPDDKDAVKKAFLLLGKEATVKSRNHWATYEREIDKVQELRRVLNGTNGTHGAHAPHAVSHGAHAPHGIHAPHAPHATHTPHPAPVAPHGNGNHAATPVRHDAQGAHPNGVSHGNGVNHGNGVSAHGTGH